jgi:tumor protein p53-inducible protein 3
MDARWVIYGTMGGIKIHEANMMKLISKRGSILTSTLRNRTDEYKKNLIEEMERDCFPGFESGKLAPIIDKSFGLTEAPAALHYMQQNMNVGKIILNNDL